LREPAARDQSLEREHEVRTDAEVLGLHRRKPEVAEDIARALRDLDRQRASSSWRRSRSSSLSRARARSISSFGVACRFFAKACSTYTASGRVARYSTRCSPSA
jgi:hypothetical protein